MARLSRFVFPGQPQHAIMISGSNCRGGFSLRQKVETENRGSSRSIESDPIDSYGYMQVTHWDRQADEH